MRDIVVDQSNIIEFTTKYSNKTSSDNIADLIRIQESRIKNQESRIKITQKS